MTTATDMLAKYLEAEKAVLEGKETRIGDRMVRQEDLNMIREGRAQWEARVAAEKARENRVPSMGGLGFSLARFDQ